MDGVKIKESEDQHTLLLGYLLLTKFNYVYLKTHVYIYIYLTFDFYCLVSHACAINYSIILIKKIHLVLTHARICNLMQH